MSNTLRRPMFRGGGKIESRGTGITSGLDDRPGYAEAGSVDLNQVKSGSEELLQLQKEMGLFNRPEVNTTFGLTRPELFNLGSRFFEFAGKGGNETFGQKLAGSASDALGDISTSMQARKEKLRDLDKEERAIKAANVGTVYDQMGQEVLAKIKAEAAGKDKSYALDSKIENIKRYKNEIFDIDNQVSEITKKYGEGIEETSYSEEDQKKLLGLRQQADIIDDILKNILKMDPVTQAVLDTDKFDDIFDLYSEKVEATIPVDNPKHYAAVIELIKKDLGISFKDGGRVKKQLGGTVQEASPEPKDTNSSSDSNLDYSLTYEQLRSRLPQEITNDIVVLLSSSMEALTDFAEIQSQEDVNKFNRMYNVNLVLPSEA